MKKAEVAPIAQPTLNIDSVDNDNLKITILCPVKPEVELGEYKGLEVKKGRVTVAKKISKHKLKTIVINSLN